MTDVPDFDVPAGGIHYVKEQRKPEPLRQEFCAMCNGRVPATCCIRLYVPPSPLSPNAGADDVSVLMCGVFFCDRHYWLLLDGNLKLKPEFRAKFLTQEVKDGIGMEFRKRGAYPSFEKATAGRVPQADDDYRRAQKAVDLNRKPQ